MDRQTRWIVLFATILAIPVVDACTSKSGSSDDSGVSGAESGLPDGPPDGNDVQVCANVCVKVEECGNLTPPSPLIPGFSSEGSGSAGLDCAANCVAPDAAFYGYADCQTECLLEESCSTMQDCWDATTNVFASYCGGDAPSIGSESNNGTRTVSSRADVAVSNPAIEEAVEASDFGVSTGSTPPDLNGLFNISGEIYESSNARPVGSRIGTELCFHNLTNSGADITIDFCEYGVPGIVSIPITGEGQDFTMYFVYPQQATILFSGTLSGDGASVSGAEALVVYTYSIDSWEKSSIDWGLVEACDGSDCTP